MSEVFELLGSTERVKVYVRVNQALGILRMAASATHSLTCH